MNSIADDIPSQSIYLEQLKSKKRVAKADENLHSGQKEEGSWAALSQICLRLDCHGVSFDVRPYQGQCCHVAVKLDFARFWKVEEIPRMKPISK